MEEVINDVVCKRPLLAEIPVMRLIEFKQELIAYFPLAVVSVSDTTNRIF
jgi:hypothetical protein